MYYKKFTLSNFPRKIMGQDYFDACDFIIKKYKNDVRVKSIYLGGGNWVPGISDLDIYIVLDNSFHGRLNIDSNKKKPANYDFVVMHRHDFFNEDSFRYLQYIFSPQVNLKLLYGIEYKIADPKIDLSNQEYKSMLLSLVTDYLTNKLLLFDRIILDKQIDVRQTLCELYSFKYTLRILEEICEAKIDNKYIQEISNLRNSWFNSDLIENLDKLLNLALSFNEELFNIISILNNYIKSSEFYFDSNKIFKNERYKISFLNENKWSSNIFLAEFKSGYVKFRIPFIKKEIIRFNLILPAPLSAIFFQYANDKGEYGKWFKSFLIKKKIKINKSDAIKKRAFILSNLLEFQLNSKDNFRFPFNYGFCINKNIIRYYIKKIILHVYLIKKFLYPKSVS